MYAHELSGARKQRVYRVINSICLPQVIIADEPTSALSSDAVTQPVMETTGPCTVDKIGGSHLDRPRYGLPWLSSWIRWR